MDNYRIDHKLGEGTGAIVYLAEYKPTGDFVAMKLIRQTKFQNGVPGDALREIKLLRELRHPNIVELRDVVSVGDEKLAMIFPVLTDFSKMIAADSGVVMSPGHIKQWMMMLCSGMEYLHSRWVLHRDMKPENIMIGQDNQLKIADFGLARTYGTPDVQLTTQVVTLSFKAPELLFQASEYGAAIDMWAVGCIFAQMMLRRPIFQAENPSEINQLGKIFHITGTPTEEDWPQMSSLPYYVEFEPAPPIALSKIVTGPAANKEALDLLEKTLCLAPLKRLSARDCLEHEYFKTRPAPTPPNKLPRLKKK
jgi:cyclin-dependent kinase 7